MASEILARDVNRTTVAGAVTDDANLEIKALRVDPTTKRLLVSATGIGTAITVNDDGTPLTTGVTSFDFVGAGVVATAVGNAVTVTINAASGFATTALDNLASVALNTALLPATAASVDHGSATKPFKDIYLAGSSGTPGTNNYKITGTSTSGTRTVTLPDASGTATLLGNTSTGSGSVVLASGPVLTTPTLGAASATTINKVTLTAPATGSTLTIADGKTLGASNSLTLAGTDATTITFQATDTYVGRATTDTLTNKTLTAPKIANAGFIADANGNEQIIFTTTASAVNELTLTNAATGNAPQIAATGGDSNIDLKLVAKGTGKIAPQKQVNFGAFTAYFTETDNGNSSTADTIDWTLSNKQKSTLTGNCTFTFTAPPGPCNLILKLVQDATGSRTVTWPAAVHWSSATAPTLTTTASQVDIVSFYYDGTTYFGQASLNFAP